MSYGILQDKKSHGTEPRQLEEGKLGLVTPK